ncbi:hypothetical protein [Goodfellowiella coeruleoviolacea]|uniref:hypothetical protein n=1 Tax=Goodfellowiella coeruleoviolacea TaxID=334858 RepID=UPI0020A55F81|nr:hypothetical protein [Goodfellowiella coeruleoviolacea]
MSAELLSEIAPWNESFPATYNTDDPAGPGFETDEEERRFNDTSRELACGIRAEVPESVKVYCSPIWDYETEEITG